MSKIYCLLLGLAITISSIQNNAIAQSINVVPNPNRPDLFAWTGSGALSGYAGNPIVLGNSLVLEYNAGGTSDVSQAVIQLAVYNGGDSLHLIPNPDAGQGVYYQSIQTVFNNKLFFIYIDINAVQHLASFDGNGITVYSNPDASPSGYIGSPRIVNNNLYVAYQNISGVTQFGRFNGNGITLIPNPDNSSAGFYNNYSVVFNNKIVSRYVTAAGPKQLAVFDGASWTVLPNPDNVATRGVQPIFPSLYHNKLYFTYLGVTGQYQFLQYDGVNNPALVPNPQNSSVNSGGVTGNFTILHNDTLFLQYYDVNNVYRLAKFDGSSITLVPNPDATTYGYWYTPVVYNNNLYILYQAATGKRHLAKYLSSNAIQLISNPDAGTGYWELPIVYGDKLYIKYANVNGSFQTGSFDGSSIQLLPNPSGIYNGSPGNNGYIGAPIVWNNALYIQYGSVPYGNAGSLAYYASVSNGICAGSNTSFTSNITGSSYQWQADNGSGTFTNLSNAAPYSGVATATLNLSAPSSALSGYKYRCVVNGNSNSNTFILLFANSWTGTVSNAWETAGNWSCGVIPDANTDVYVNSGTPNSPLINSNRSVKSIHLQNGSNLVITAGRQLIITGK